MSPVSAVGEKLARGQQLFLKLSHEIILVVWSFHSIFSITFLQASKILF